MLVLRKCHNAAALSVVPRDLNNPSMGTQSRLPWQRNKGNRRTGEMNQLDSSEGSQH
jgi:hypothetical protein